jgi:hypothetical protein
MPVDIHRWNLMERWNRGILGCFSHPVELAGGFSSFRHFSKLDRICRIKLFVVIELHIRGFEEEAEGL